MVPTCWWHPDRRTGLRCARCERYACPDCLREAAVGYQCIDCVDSARREHRANQARYRKSGFGYRTVAGARASATAVVTPVLIALNVLVFAATAAQSQSLMGNAAAALFQQWVLAPPAVAIGDWWRLLTSGFLHYGLLHLGVNMLALWILGKDLELLLGKLRYLSVYLLSLLGGGTAVYVFGGAFTATAGASGAVYGLMGGLLIAVLRLKLRLAPVLGIIVINLVITVSIPGISLLGHLGGLVIGALATAAMLYAPQARRVVVQTSVLVALAVVLVILVVGRTTVLSPELTVFTDPVYGEVICGDAIPQCMQAPG